MTTPHPPRPGPLRRLLLSFGSACFLLGGWFWWTLFSPFGYHPPADLEPIVPNREYRVFAFGTLRSPLVRLLVIGRRVPTTPATLPHYERLGLDIRPLPHALTPGVVFTVSARELLRLDRYERRGVRYRRLELPLNDDSLAWVYQRLPASIQAPH